MRGKCCVDSHAFRDEGKRRKRPAHVSNHSPELSNGTSPLAKPEVPKMTNEFAE